MSRFVARSLLGQMAIVFGAALLLAQLVSLAYLLVERDHFSRAEIDAPAITRFSSVAADYVQASADFRLLVIQDASRRGSHYAVGNAPGVNAELKRRKDTEARLREALGSVGVSATQVLAAIDPNPARPSSAARRGRLEPLLISARLPGGAWLNGSILVPAQPPLITPDLIVGSILLYAFVLAAAVVLARRIARPLHELTGAAEAFRGGNHPVEVRVSGPMDVRNAVLAFNAMNARVAALLEDKDRTLGAIGHDLRTPLASLRIRVESVEPADERSAMIATIEEMSATLDDILTLARSGRSGEVIERTDLNELLGAISSEFVSLGEQVTFAPASPCFVDVQRNLLRRAVRNLVDNAAKYAGSAKIEVECDGATHRISVLDRGPGIPGRELGHVASAFYRGEPSRNRETGGAGLGLSIADTIVEALGGRLTIANRDGGGLAATIELVQR